jgi:ribosomal protein S18 acetylase RimI-like enzyme
MIFWGCYRKETNITLLSIVFYRFAAMEHVLDNPAWNALTSGNKNLANGNHTVKYFDKEVSPFVGFKNNTAEDFKTLYNLLPHNGPVGFITPVEIQIPQEWKVLQCIRTFQMVFDGTEPLPALNIEPLALRDEHIPQMLALTQLTKPGPFATRTIDFGHYQGIFDGNKLIALTGQRMHVFNYAEISAVCTHPDYLGRGYAKQLLLSQIHRIKAAANIPFLHVRFDNERAVKVYQSLGFKTRKDIYFYILQKTS